MKKYFYIFVIALFFSGCGTLKQKWNNFNAYYNTFYNTQLFYNEGVKKNKRQISDIVHQQKIHIYPSPTVAGGEDFDEAIVRGSSILRNHEGSKYVLPAISIIGKSYYYKGEFFSALEKFRELQVLANTSLQQEAIFWQGLTYIELGNYQEGARFLETELDIVENWTPRIEASVFAVLGQLYGYTEDYEQALLFLGQAIDGLERNEEKARAYFLQGQILELSQRDNQALFAYDRSGDLSTNFDLEFNALRKEAEISRKIGSYPRAENIYSTMSRDDKFFEYRNELRYEIARTLQLSGEADEAIKIFNEVLSDLIQPASTLTKAKAYNALGEVFRDQKNNYITAAAYFDSASVQRADLSLLPDTFNATEMAEILGRYTTYKSEISSRDSLLNLAQMGQDELNSFIEELQIKEAERLENELQEMQSERDRMLVAEPTDSIIATTESLEYGFLNINNPVQLADASLQFQAVWGDRALSDNWRRATEVTASRFDRPVGTDAASGDVAISSGGMEETGIVPQIDLSDIPFHEDDQQQLHSEIEEYHYRLGNVFFLSLDKPDSAAVYFQKVVESKIDSQLLGMSFYSLSEIALLQNNIEQAEYWFDELRIVNPNSVFTARLSDRLQIPQEVESSQESDQQEFILDDIVNAENSEPNIQTAQQFVQAAERSDDQSKRAMLLFEAAREYMKIARMNTMNESIVSEWFQRKQEADSLQNEFSAKKDSADVMLSDSTLLEEERLYWQQIADSTMGQIDLSEYFPYQGAYWDSSRTLLSSISSEFPSSSVQAKVDLLIQELTPPLTVIEETDTDSIESSPVEAEPVNSEETFQLCSDLNIELDR